MTETKPHLALEFSAIALGGVIGALARYVGDFVAEPLTGQFPWATFAENVTGSFALGFTIAVLIPRVRHPLFAPFAAIGLLGSYTTFSTYMVGAVTLADDGRSARAIAYVLGTLVFGLVAVWLGHLCARLFREREPT